ncbi:MAG: hypothetical protein M3N52_02815 [Actinomycetota bacterium]|nr:hypothetical protein [Actinomycetota bacterium]
MRRRILLVMVRRRVQERPGADDLRAGHDANDEQVVRALQVARRPATQPLEPSPPVPLRADEVVCRSCRLAVRRPDLGDVVLLVCDDCYR